jgi:hypothetical protein
MLVPGRIGPAWSLRLFRRVSLVFFLVPLVGTLACFVSGRLSQAAAAATSALLFGCNWQCARRFTLAMEKWIRRPGYQQTGGLPDDPSSNTTDRR